MTTAADKVFLDTNVLVYIHMTLAPLHAAALGKVQSLHASGAELWISRQIMREYLSAMTRPGVLTGSIPLASLAADVRSFASRFHVAEDGP
jgi:predicted nucleic acid-binding protein